MRTIRKNFKLSAVVLALSITALPGLVNGQGQSLSSVNSAKSSNKSDLKDSIKDSNARFAQLIEALMKTGTDGEVGNNLAPVIGLAKSMPTKDAEIVIHQQDTDIEKRGCFIVYENVEHSTSQANEKRPVCAYIVKIKRSSRGKESKYFKIGLDGKLEKAILSQGKFDESGKAVRGSGVKTDLDVNSADVKKTFEAEMKFWLKDWLKKQQKAPSKKA